MLKATPHRQEPSFLALHAYHLNFLVYLEEVVIVQPFISNLFVAVFLKESLLMWSMFSVREQQLTALV